MTKLKRFMPLLVLALALVAVVPAMAAPPALTSVTASQVGDVLQADVVGVDPAATHLHFNVKADVGDAGERVVWSKCFPVNGTSYDLEPAADGDMTVEAASSDDACQTVSAYVTSAEVTFDSPHTVDMAGITATLDTGTGLGLLGVITIGATIFVAAMLYKRFRS